MQPLPIFFIPIPIVLNFFHTPISSS